jgi:hypothetical protein
LVCALLDKAKVVGGIYIAPSAKNNRWSPAMAMRTTR